MFDTMRGWKRDLVLVILFSILTLVLLFVPTGFEKREPDNLVRARGEITAVNNAEIQQFNVIKTGDQYVTVRILEGPFEGREFDTDNKLLGRMDLDKIYEVGDTVLAVLTLDDDGDVINVNPQDHYRIGLELLLFGLFALLLVVFAGWTGLKALLSFVFAALMIWKGLVPLTLEGWDPVLLSLGIVAVLTGAIIFLVAGPTRKGVVAFLGAFLGVLTSCLLAVYFTDQFHMHGAVLPFAETLLYSGYGHLDLNKIYVAAVFLAASGAVMDLAMDVAASQHEVICRNPDLSRMEAIKSGFAVGRAVVGTMTTTLLLAYSGGYITLFMAFMAQGIPMVNFFNMIYVAAEVLKTLVGSFGLVMVGPFTAIIGGLIFVGPRTDRCGVDPVRGG
jgi:uncharacterized membrane protein